MEKVGIKERKTDLILQTKPFFSSVVLYYSDSVEAVDTDTAKTGSSCFGRMHKHILNMYSMCDVHTTANEQRATHS